MSSNFNHHPAQNIANTSIMGQMGVTNPYNITNGNLNTTYRSPPDITGLSEKELLSLNEQIKNSLNQIRKSGPSNLELEEHPALKDAWETYMIVRKLQGLKE